MKKAEIYKNNQILEGWVTIGHEVRLFEPCFRKEALWLMGRSPALKEIMAAYRRTLPDEKTYRRLERWFMSLLQFPTIDKSLKPWFDWKGRFNKNYGFSFGFDCSALGQAVSDSPGEDSAAGGIFRFFGNWSVIGRESVNTGSIVYKVENRHTLVTDIPPQDPGFEAGYLGITGTAFSDYDGWGLAFSAAWFVDDTWMPYLRAGYSDDGGALLERSVSAGIGYYFKDSKDLLGFGLNWGRPPDSGLDDQYTAELFYRLPDLGYNMGMYLYTPWRPIYSMQSYGKQKVADALQTLPDKPDGLKNLKPILENLSGHTVIFLFTDGPDTKAEVREPGYYAEELAANYDICFYIISSAKSKVNEKIAKQGLFLQSLLTGYSI